MEVKAIDSLSLMNFEGTKNSKKHNQVKQDYPQMDSPASRKASKAMRDMMMGLIMLGATAGGLSSCDDMIEATADAHAWATAWAWSCGGQAKNDTTVIHDTINNTDTVFVTEIVPRNFKEYPFHVADSLIAQGLNIGVELDGKVPSAENNNIVFLAGKAHNRYDNIYYEIQAQDHGTTGEVLSTITKCVDMYDSNNPKTYWIKSDISDLPGEGLQFINYITTKEPNKYTNWGAPISREVRTNNQDGTNTVKTFDYTGKLVSQQKEGRYIKGIEKGTFMFEETAYDDDGNPFIDPEDGQIVKVLYDFDNGKMWSQKVERVEVPDTTTTYYYGTK